MRRVKYSEYVERGTMIVDKKHRVDPSYFTTNSRNLFCMNITIMDYLYRVNYQRDSIRENRTVVNSIFRTRMMLIIPIKSWDIIRDYLQNCTIS